MPRQQTIGSSLARQRPRLRAWLLVLCLPLAFCAALWPVAGTQAHGLVSAGPQHALPIHYDPGQNAVLRAPPTRVQIKFSEHVNPDISKLVVVDPSNRQVDNRDSEVSDDGYTITVTLPLLPAGTYVVFWRTHSADDGHVAGGSYLFHIARSDGTVPPLSGPLPRGNLIGGAGVATGSLDPPGVLALVARWIGTLALTLLLGLTFWALVVLPRQSAVSNALASETRQRMRQIAWYALLTLLAASVLDLLAQLVIVEGSLKGIFAIPLLRTVLLHSRFGLFVLARMALALVALGAFAWERRKRAELVAGPARAWLIAGGSLALAFLFEYAGHGGAAPVWWGPVIDYLHLVASGVWLGGLFTIVVALIPVLRTRPESERNAWLAAALPAFSLPALVAVAFLTLTGPLNGTVRMTALAQIWTTAYGRTLIVKSLIFLGMVAISYYHAFRLRPRLAAVLPQGGSAQRGLGGGADLSASWSAAFLARAEALLSGVRLTPSGTLAVRGDAVTAAPTENARRLAQDIVRWLRVEAGLGVALLFCAALLGPLAGTLLPVATNAASFGAQGGKQSLTAKADDLTVTLSVDPGKFGTNTFTIVVTNPDGSPASDGTVFLVSTMVEMDMGANTIDLVPVAGQAGTYSGQGELPMAGHWNLQVVIRTKQDPSNLHRTEFTISASY
jgi:copper transport protein